MNITSRVRIIAGVSAAVAVLGIAIPGATMAASVGGRCTKAGAKSGALTCNKGKSGKLAWARTTATTKKTSATTPASSAPASSPAASTPAASTPAASAPAASAPAAGITYTLKEWSIDGPAQLTAGKINLSVVNAPGNSQHELKVIKGTFAELPKAANGAVDEAQLPAGAILGKVDRFAGGETKTTSLDLPAGKYLFVCNIGFGPNSHAARGQVLDVTVA